MADFNAVGFDDAERLILSHSDKVADVVPKMLNAGADVLVKAQKTQLTGYSRTAQSIGTLKNSIGKGTVKKAKRATEYYIDVYPQGDQPHGTPGTGTRRGGKQEGKKFSRGKGNVSNAQVGFTLEYGRSDLPARPWMSAANAKAENAVHDAIREVWDKEMNED